MNGRVLHKNPCIHPTRRPRKLLNGVCVRYVQVEVASEHISGCGALVKILDVVIRRLSKSHKVSMTRGRGQLYGTFARHTESAGIDPGTEHIENSTRNQTEVSARHQGSSRPQNRVGQQSRTNVERGACEASCTLRVSWFDC